MALAGGSIHLEHTHGGKVANLTIENGNYNIVTFEMRARMDELFHDIDADDTVRTVVIRGAGKHFTSGGDIGGFMEVAPFDFTDLGHDITAPARSPKPVIAAIDGYCFGVGLELALAADIRVSTQRAQFALPEMKLGMIPGSGGTQRLARLIGPGRAKYHVMTGRRISAQDALLWGMVSSTCVDSDGLQLEVDGLLEEILSYSPAALRTAKEVLDRGVDGPLYTGIELERKAYAMLRSTEDFSEGVSAFVEKRPARFKGH